jgi:uncharacterized damage-inducible protein DinB
VDGEKAALAEFLAAQRTSVLAIIDGLDDRALRTPVVPSGWTPLGLLEHLAHAERHWLQDVLLGRSDPLPWADDGPGPFTSTHPAAAVLAFYRDTCARSDEILAATPLCAVPYGTHPDPDLAAQTTDLRRILLHLIEETARHAGHLDLARELLDGRTGLGPR